MKTRWHVGEDFWVMAGCVYAFGWLPIAIAIQCIFGAGMGEKAPLCTAYIVFLSVWFGSVLVPAAAWLLARMARLAWVARPRRIAEPVVEDLRRVGTDA